MMLSTESQDPKLSSAPSSQISGSRKAWAIVITILGTMIVGVVVLEIIFRLFVPVIDVAWVFWDPVVGQRRAPDQSGHTIKDHVNARFHFNGQGWNNEHEYTTVKPAGSRRICVVGDSQVQSFEVNLDQTFFTLAEQLMSKAGRPTEWYSFGCSGFGWSQEEAVIRHYALDYHPDLVLLLFVENDPHDSSPYIFPVENFVTSYYLDENNQLVLLTPHYWARSALRRWLTSTALARYFLVQKDVFHRQSGDAFAIGGIYLREGPKNRTSLHQVPGLEKLSIEDRERLTWVVIEKVMAKIRDECKDRGAKFAVVYRGHTRILAAALSGETYKPAPKSADPYCLRYDRLFEMGTDYLEPMMKRLGVPYLDMTEPIRQMVAETKQSHVVPNDGHWSENTHALAAKVLSEWCERLLAEPSSK